MVKTFIDPIMVKWLKDSGLYEEFSEAMRILKVVIPDVYVDSIKLYKNASGHDMVLCVVDDIDRTSFITKRAEYFKDLSQLCPNVFKILKLIRHGRFGNDSTVEIKTQLP